MEQSDPPRRVDRSTSRLKRHLYTGSFYICPHRYALDLHNLSSRERGENVKALSILSYPENAWMEIR